MNRDAVLGEAGLHGLGVVQEEFRFGVDEPPTSKGGRARPSRPSFESEASIVIRRAEDVLLARSAAELLTANLLGDRRRRELVGHAVTELGQNILKHHDDGTIAFL